MARLQQRAASVLLAALLLSAVSVDGAGLWGGSKKSADPVKVAPAAKAVVAATPKAVVPAGDGHNVYWYNEVTGEASETDPLVEMHGHKSLENEATYWVDPETGASVWERPAAYAWASTPSEEHPDREYYYNSVTKETTWDKPVILGWKPAEKGFWFNNITGASQWELPDALGIETVVDGEKRRYWVVDGTPTWTAPTEYAWRQLVSPDGDGKVYFENTATAAVTWERPAALGWSRRSVGKTFWYDSVTGASQRDVPAHAVGHEHESGQRFFVDADGKTTWERPAAAAWTETPSDKHDGRTYFHNNVTQEVVWERPADSNVAWQQHHEEL